MEEQDVFISFASQERNLAEAIKQFVEAAFECEAFVSDTTITAGEIWQDEIVTALCNAKLLLVLCSPFSISRQWVNFECGAAHLPGKEILFLCHSGLTKAQLPQKHESHPWLLNQEKACDVHDSNFVDKLVEKIGLVLTNTKKRGNFDGIEHKGIIDKAIREVVGRLRQQSSAQKKFLKFTLTKTNENNTIHIEAVGETKDEETKKHMENDAWVTKVKEMNLFLRGEKNDIGDVGVAIGIQNCLFDGNDIYVGVRMKAIGDANATSVGVAMGSFNTGYQLMKLEQDKLKFESESTLQDLFVSKKEIKRSLYKKDAFKEKEVEIKDKKQIIIEKMRRRLEAFNSKLWFINFSNEQTSDEQASVATIFINSSRWCPRFEIGVWKFIDISKDKTNLENNILAGFGEDIFLDYRGQEDVEGMNVNPWIWAKNGVVKYWSYPEERLIPRLKPTNYSEPKTAVLVSANYMSEIYGNQRKYTPFASTEDLTDDNVIEGQFSLPARSLLSCF